MSGDAELERTCDADPSVETGSDEPDEDVTAHLDDLEDGAGCTEIWSHLSAARDE